jgi:hypothetical protein
VRSCNAVAAALLILAVVACSGDTGRNAAQNSASPAPRAAAATIATTTATEASTTSTVPKDQGDVDGDAVPDQVTTTLDDTAFTVIADMTTLGRQSVVVANAELLLLANEVSQGRPVIYGVVDVDGDGRAEIFAETDHGASTAFFTIIKIVRGRMVQVMLEDTPVELTFAGSVRHYQLLGCDTGELVWAGFGSEDDDLATFESVRIVYRFAGAELEQVAKTTHTFTANPDGSLDPGELAAFGYDLHCPIQGY